jgi:thiamine-monophosphate kinase
LAVNLSDMAAAGAQPRWVMLAAALPEADEAWISAFAQGFIALADEYEVDLIGGDTTRGPLNFCVQIMGEVPAGAALTRGGARAGDDIWVSGELGDAALALAHLRGQRPGDAPLDEAALALVLQRLHMPAPRVALGLALRGVASSCIDISDGLLQDLGHILERSQVGAEVRLADVPRSRVLAAHPDRVLADQCVFAGGDDYELCFTAPAARRDDIIVLAGRLALPLTHIGTIAQRPELRTFAENGVEVQLRSKGFDHFA